MAFLLVLLMHQATQAGWLALQQPAVTDMLGPVMGVPVNVNAALSGAPFRRLRGHSSHGGHAGHAGEHGHTSHGHAAARGSRAFGRAAFLPFPTFLLAWHLARPHDPTAVSHEEQGEVPATLILVLSFVVPIIALVVLSALYKSKVTDKRPPLPQPVPEEFALDHSKFKYDRIDCMYDLHYCLHGCILSDVQAADVFSTVGASAFWNVPLLFFGTWVLFELISFGLAYGLSSMSEAAEIEVATQQQDIIVQVVAWLLASAPMTLKFAQMRQTLRSRLGDPDPQRKCFGDCMCYWFCHCCSVIQDVRQVDGAMGVQLECCCTLRKLPSANNPDGAAIMGIPITGPPVMVGTAGAPAGGAPIATETAPVENNGS